ncbi:MAG: hypothetical protein R3E35_04955 [Rhodocyclaceae bacterium]
MSTIPQIYDQSELALAAYANLTPGVTNDLVRREALVAAGFSAKQAEEFARKYPVVVTQFNDTVAEGGLGTSFSATVFKDASGNLTLAIRGTAELFSSPSDLFPTDATIATSGVGYDQIVAMWNWWQRVSNPADAPVTQYRLVATPADLSHATWLSHAGAGNTGLWLEWYTGTANGSLQGALAADADRKLDLTGHSLGGHLAMAFGSIFPSASNQITVFNAPGFLDDTDNHTFFALLGGAIPNGANTTNVIADEANVGLVPWSGIAGLHSRPGTAIDISIENQWQGNEPLGDRPGALNHSQQTLTDALAVYAVLARIDSTLSTTAYKTILAAAAIGTSDGLERIIDALEGVLGINASQLASGNANRDALYQAIYGLREHGGYQALQAAIVPLTALDAATLVQADVSGGLYLSPLSVRYALKELNPFLIDAPDALYAQHNTGGRLDLHDPATGQGQLTAEYLADRAALLVTVNAARSNDSAVGGTLIVNPTGSDTVIYTDKTSSLKLRDGQATLDPRRIVFGKDQSDGSTETLSCGNFADHLYGAGGNDILHGQGGNDYLEGGAGHDILIGGTGHDIYQVGAGGGSDTIDDVAEGPEGRQLGEVRFGATAVTGTFTALDPEQKGFRLEAADGVYLATYSGSVQNNLPGTLWLWREGRPEAVAVIHNFRSGDLGILLGGGAPPRTYTDIVGTQEADNDKLDIAMAHDATLVATAAAQKVFGLGGADYIVLAHAHTLGYGGAGNDRIVDSAGAQSQYGEDGDDVLLASAGNDELYGGAGNDALQGGADDDLIFDSAWKSQSPWYGGKHVPNEGSRRIAP